jgi:hypothetical protein
VEQPRASAVCGCSSAVVNVLPAASMSRFLKSSTTKIQRFTSRGNGALQSRNPRAIHLAHPARANRVQDLVGSQPSSRRQVTSNNSENETTR